MIYGIKIILKFYLRILNIGLPLNVRLSGLWMMEVFIIKEYYLVLITLLRMNIIY
jgi:hypothetical protein